MARILLFLLMLLPAPAAWSFSGFEGLERLEQALRLNAEQKAQFDVAVLATQRAMVSSARSGLEFRDTLRRELLKPRPDLDEIFRAQERVVDRNRPLFRAARDEWVRLYALLDEEQVRIARNFIEDRLARLEGVAEALRGFLTQ